MPSPLSLLSETVSAVLDRSRAGFSGTAVSPGVALVVVCAVTVGTVLGIVGLGLAFDATIDETVTVDNPDRPPEWVCESSVHDDDSPLTAGCDAPQRIAVDAGTELREAAMGHLHYGLFGVPVWWLLFGVVLHVGARVSGGGGSFGDSLVVAAWAIVPELLRLAAGVAAIWYALATAEIAGGTTESIATDVIAAISTVSTPLAVVSAITITVQWVIVVGGLEATHDLDRGVAAAVAGVFACLAFLLALA
ncbi:YIP1 family protein [Halorubrum sp. DTA98]|uniref:YIP1 family protein n=1 Tax=Halorubrum sp. DTA98 TaxID=3402163 RepID=UPI003AAC443F